MMRLPKDLDMTAESHNLVQDERSLDVSPVREVPMCLSEQSQAASLIIRPILSKMKYPVHPWAESKAKMIDQGGYTGF